MTATDIANQDWQAIVCGVIIVGSIFGASSWMLWRIEQPDKPTIEHDEHEQGFL